MFSVLVGGQSLVGGYRPVDAKRGIAPQKAPIVLWRVIGAHLIEDFRIRLERAVTMSEPLRHKDLVPFGSAEHGGDMPTECRGTPANIDRDIKNGTRGYARQLCLQRGE